MEHNTQWHYGDYYSTSVGAMTKIIMTQRIIALTTMTLSIMTISNDTQHNVHTKNNRITCSAIMQSVFMHSVIILCGIMASVVAPKLRSHQNFTSNIVFNVISPQNFQKQTKKKFFFIKFKSIASIVQPPQFTLFKLKNKKLF